MNVLLIGAGYWGKIIKFKLDKLCCLKNILASDDNIECYLKTNKDIECVFVCTPTDTHYEIVNYCIKNGIKKIFCEKPFTGDYNKAKELLNLANQKKIKIFIDNVFLYRKECMNILSSDFERIFFTWKKYEEKKDNNYKDNIINTLLYHDMYLLINFTNESEWTVEKKLISEDKLFLELKNKDTSAIFDYDRCFKDDKIKKIILDKKMIDLTLPKNDPLCDIINNIKNNNIDFRKNNELTLKTLKLITLIV